MSALPLWAEIVITGIGICSPLGPDRETTWRRLLAGESGITPLDPAWLKSR